MHRCRQTNKQPYPDVRGDDAGASILSGPFGGQNLDLRDRHLQDRRLQEMTAIKARLYTTGITLASIDLKFGLARGTAGTTLREPNAAGERAIAAALGSRPELLWHSRYHGSGLRKSPQPPQNYARPATMAQRLNGEGE